MDGVAFARRARSQKLVVQPDILLLTPPGLRLPKAGDLPALGAGTLETPIDEGRLSSALRALADRPRTLPEGKAARLDALMDALGVPRHPGRECLAVAVTLAWHDAGRLASLKEGIYPEVARRTGLSPAQVERAIRHAIEVAWDRGDIDTLNSYFGYTIQNSRGKPTNSEFIAMIADNLRLKYKYATV
jgi:two-component system response regulator (stage 0 sporulation protein A)